MLGVHCLHEAVFTPEELSDLLDMVSCQVPISPPPQVLFFVRISFVKAWLAGPWLIPARQREAERSWRPSCLSSLLPDVLQFLGSRTSLTVAHVLNKWTISWELVGVWEQSFLGLNPTSACDLEDMN